MRALSVMALLWGVSVTAQPALPTYTMTVTTKPLTGAALDTVVASVVDAGVLLPPSMVPMTLRILDDSGAVVATVTGTVTATTPLRVSVTAPSSGGLRAQVILPHDAWKMSAGILLIERLGHGVPPPPGTRQVCEIPPSVSRDPDTGTGDPVTVKGCRVEVEEN
ncbi:hypothetical protein D7Y23_16805 [Corallococcus sp. AB050B]|nr:hypothetical protein D7Y23_16805 [Corallococcus sp. AB050B]